MPMKMQDDNFKALFQKYLDETITPEEYEQLAAFIGNNHPEQAIDELWQDALNNPAYVADGREHDLDAIFRDIVVHKPVRIRKLRWIGYAAAILMLIAATGIYYLSQRSAEPETERTQATDIAPGTNKALLTLADGSTVALDSNGNQLIRQGGTTIRQTGGQLTYDAQGAGETVSYNILTTPRGGQFYVKLPDGTAVWLNAASTLRYPTVFNGTERKVEVTGEVYFEVTKNVRMPFRVMAGNRAVIEVLGTRFNVSAYEGEKSLNTTLLDGAVKVTATHTARHQVALKPGQEARLSGDLTVINDPDIDKVMAWKNGLFNFEGASLQEVMNELERWYDIEVVYVGNIPDIHFGGELSRDKSLAGVIAALKDAEVRFRIEGRKLVVMP